MKLLGNSYRPMKPMGISISCYDMTLRGDFVNKKSRPGWALCASARKSLIFFPYVSKFLD